MSTEEHNPHLVKQSLRSWYTILLMLKTASTLLLAVTLGIYTWFKKDELITYQIDTKLYTHNEHVKSLWEDFEEANTRQHAILSSIQKELNHILFTQIAQDRSHLLNYSQAQNISDINDEYPSQGSLTMRYNNIKQKADAAQTHVATFINKHKNIIQQFYPQQIPILKQTLDKYKDWKLNIYKLIADIKEWNVYTLSDKYNNSDQDEWSAKSKPHIKELGHRIGSLPTPPLCLVFLDLTLYNLNIQAPK